MSILLQTLIISLKQIIPFSILIIIQKKIKHQKSVYGITVENYAEIYKIHKIFITIDFQKKISTVKEIEKAIGNEIKQHLTKQEFKGCNINQMRSFIEKYNSTFNITSTDWLKTTSTTDIFIKSEKNDKNEIKTLSMFYEKRTKFKMQFDKF